MRMIDADVDLPMRITSMKYDLTSLYLFMCVAEERSISAASRRAHTAISAISKRITDLEAKVGVQLFERKPKGVELTTAGRLMYQRCSVIFNSLHDIDLDMSGFAEGISGEIRIAATTSVLTQFLPNDIASFSRLFSNVSFNIEERMGDGVIDLLTKNKVDLGFFSENTEAPEGIEIKPYKEDQLVVGVPKGHPLTDHDSVTLKQALKYSIIGSHKDSALYSLLTKHASTLNHPFSAKIKVSSFDCMCNLIIGGLGVGILPSYMVDIYSKSIGLTAVPLNESWANRNLLVGYSSYQSQSPAVKKFLDQIL